MKDKFDEQCKKELHEAQFREGSGGRLLIVLCILGLFAVYCKHCDYIDSKYKAAYDAGNDMYQACADYLAPTTKQQPGERALASNGDQTGMVTSEETQTEMGWEYEK